LVEKQPSASGIAEFLLSAFRSVFEVMPNLIPVLSTFHFNAAAGTFDFVGRDTSLSVVRFACQRNRNSSLSRSRNSYGVFYKVYVNRCRIRKYHGTIFRRFTPVNLLRSLYFAEKTALSYSHHDSCLHDSNTYFTCDMYATWG